MCVKLVSYQESLHDARSKNVKFCRKNVEHKGKLSFTSVSKVWVSPHSFSRTSQLVDRITCRHPVPPLTKGGQKCRYYGQKVMYSLQQITAAAGLIVMKFALTLQSFVNTYYTAFHANLTNSLVFDTRPRRRDGRCLHIKLFFSLLHNERLIETLYFVHTMCTHTHTHIHTHIYIYVYVYIYIYNIILILTALFRPSIHKLVFLMDKCSVLCVTYNVHSCRLQRDKHMPLLKHQNV